jgi:hypothetical protein
MESSAAAASHSFRAPTKVISSAEDMPAVMSVFSNFTVRKKRGTGSENPHLNFA